MRETTLRDTPEVRRPLRLRPVRPAGWWFDGLLLAAFVALTLALANGMLLDLDVTMRDWADTHRPEVAYWLARALNYLGQGGLVLLPVTGALALVLAVRTRSLRPGLVVGAAFLLTSLAIGPLKLWTDRAAPSSPDLPPKEAVQLFNTLPPAEWDLSYPSGHVANTLVYYGAVALLLAALLGERLPRGAVRVIRLAPPLIVLITTTYLSFHWLTDGLAALLLGLVLQRLLTRIPYDDVPLPALPYGLHRPALFTVEP